MGGTGRVAKARVRFAAGFAVASGRAAWRAVRAYAAPIAAVIGLVVASWGLGHAALRGVRRIEPLYAAKTLRDERGQSSFFDCIERAARGRLPRGATVFIANSDVATVQRMTELVTPWARPVADRRVAQFAIRLDPGNGPGSCGGNVVSVTTP